MVQIIQQGPSEATLRQQALDLAMQNIVGGIAGYQSQKKEEAKTLRQQALADEALKSQKALQEQNLQLKLLGSGIEQTPAQAAIPEQIIQKELAGPVRPGEQLGSTQEIIPAKAAVPAGFRYTPAKQAEQAAAIKKQEQESKILEGRVSALPEESLKRQLDLRKTIEDMSLSPIKRRTAEAQLGKLEAETAKIKTEGTGAGQLGKLDKKIIETQAIDTAKSVSNLNKVKAAMDKALVVLNDPNVSEDQKLKTGQGLFKLMNSAEGSDAVGAEEAKRIGSFLEFNLANFTQPGAFFGRDVEGFVDQVKNYSDLLGERVKSGNESLNQLRKGVFVGQGAHSTGVLAPEEQQDYANLKAKQQNMVGR